LDRLLLEKERKRQTEPVSNRRLEKKQVPSSKKTTFYPFLFFSEKKEQIEDFFGTASEAVQKTVSFLEGEPSSFFFTKKGIRNLIKRFLALL
jgi:hypothetical protein